MHEDVPYAFVPFVSIAQQLGVAAPVTRGIVELCGTAFNSDFWAEGPDAARVDEFAERIAAAIQRALGSEGSLMDGAASSSMSRSFRSNASGENGF